MTPARRIVHSLLAASMLLTSASALAQAPVRGAMAARPGKVMQIARRVAAAGLIGAAGIAAAEPGETATATAEVATPITSVVFVTRAQPSYAEMANAQLREIGVPGNTPHFESVKDRVGRGLLAPLHKIAEDRYFETGSTGARLARALTDSNHFKYGWNPKKHSYSITYTTTW